MLALFGSLIVLVTVP